MTELTDSTQDLNSLWDETDDEGVATTPVETAGDSDETEDRTEDTEEEDTSEDTEEEDTEEGQDEGEEGDEEEEVDYEALWKKAQNEVKTMTGRLKATESRLTQEKEELAKKVPAAPVAPSEEDAFLSKFKETYSEDVIKAIDLITSRKASQIIESTINTRFTPVEAATNEIISHAHFGAIEAAHPDFEEIDESPVFESWLQTRPIHIRAAYDNIRNHGTPAQVISMLSEYKETIGAGKPKTKTTKVSEAKIAAATAVGRKRGTVQTAAAPNANDIAAFWAETDD